MSFLFILSGNVNKASSRVRGYWVAKQLRLKGKRVKTLDNRAHLSLVLALLFIPFYKIIVFQKTYSRYHITLMKWAKIWSKTCLLDIDDAPSRIGAVETLKNFGVMVKGADLVIAGSDALLEYVKTLGAKRAVLIPSTVDLDHYKVESVTKPVFTLGWIGNGKDYKEDLIIILKPVLAALSKQHNIKFILIGVNGASELYEAFNAIENLEVEFIEQMDWSDADAISKQINRMDVGLYPLLENDFNKFKCAFKAIEYMACGVPVISSDLAFNTAVIDHNADGFIAKTEDQWVSYLHELMDSRELVTSMGLSGRQKVEKLYNSKLAAEKLLTAFA